MRSWCLTSILVAALCGAAAGRQATPAPQREPSSAQEQVAASQAASPPRPTRPPQLDALLTVMGDRVSSYIKGLSSIVCRERYTQRLEREDVSGLCLGAPCVTTQVVNRTLESDYLLVQLPGANGWVPFRDVSSVDGAPVRDRGNRLLALFVEADADRMAQAERIRSESSRYNIGRAMRDINVPTFALQFLLPQVQLRFTFRLGSRERASGIEAQVIEYEEVARPTIVKGFGEVDLPVRGRFWVEPESGTVLRARMETSYQREKRVIEVTFRQDPKHEIPVPDTMDERYTGPDERINARATYSDIRRFQVVTTAVIGNPR